MTHHPLIELSRGKGDRPRNAAVDANVHLLLAGHHHRPFSGSAAAFLAAGASMLVVQAGTTTSAWPRAHANSFDLIETEGDALRVAVHARDGSRFAAEAHEAYRFDGERWQGGKA